MVNKNIYESIFSLTFYFRIFGTVRIGLATVWFVFQTVEPILWNIIIIITRLHELYLNRPVSASSNSLFKGRPSRLHQFGLKFSNTVGILLMFILVTCRSQLNLYLLSFSSTDSTFSSYRMSSYLLWPQRVHPSVMKNFILILASRIYPFFF